MKRIVLKNRVIFNHRKDGKVVESFVFEKGKAYEVADAIASSKFIKERLASVEAIKAEPVKKQKAEKAEKEAEDVKSASND